MPHGEHSRNVWRRHQNGIGLLTLRKLVGYSKHLGVHPTVVPMMLYGFGSIMLGKFLHVNSRMRTENNGAKIDKRPGYAGLRRYTSRSMNLGNWLHNVRSAKNRCEFLAKQKNYTGTHIQVHFVANEQTIIIATL